MMRRQRTTSGIYLLQQRRFLAGFWSGMLPIKRPVLMTTSRGGQ
jgi:hypothetical protein